MKSTLTPQNDFAAGLKTIRNARGLSQEDFGLVSSRTYVSSLERGLKSPTMSKVDDLASALGVHPLTLLTMSYVRKPSQEAASELLTNVLAELQAVMAKK